MGSPAQSPAASVVFNDYSTTPASYVQPKHSEVDLSDLLGKRGKASEDAQSVGQQSNKSAPVAASPSLPTPRTVSYASASIAGRMNGFEKQN